jgi:hypothetical protein
VSRHIDRALALCLSVRPAFLLTLGEDGRKLLGRRERIHLMPKSKTFFRFWLTAPVGLRRSLDRIGNVSLVSGLVVYDALARPSPVRNLSVFWSPFNASALAVARRERGMDDKREEAGACLEFTVHEASGALRDQGQQGRIDPWQAAPFADMQGPSQETPNGVLGLRAQRVRFRNSSRCDASRRQVKRSLQKWFCRSQFARLRSD